MQKNIANIKTLIAEVQARTSFGSWGWESCYSGMAWNISGKPTIFPSVFSLGSWLGIDSKRQAKLEYLYDLNPDGSNENNI